MVLGLPCHYPALARCHASKSDASSQVKTRELGRQLRDLQQPIIFVKQRTTEISDDVCLQRA
jgi:hypothetical protein